MPCSARPAPSAPQNSGTIPRRPLGPQQPHLNSRLLCGAFTCGCPAGGNCEHSRTLVGCGLFSPPTSARGSPQASAGLPASPRPGQRRGCPLMSHGLRLARPLLPWHQQASQAPLWARPLPQAGCALLRQRPAPLTQVMGLAPGSLRRVWWTAEEPYFRWPTHRWPHPYFGYHL